MAIFNRGDDMERIIIQSPWTFDKKLIQITRFESDMQPTAVKFTHSLFWIRIHNLPILSMVREVGEDVGNHIGRLVEVDLPDNGIVWGRCGRVGHSGNECLEGRRSGGDPNISNDRFGSWLRAVTGEVLARIDGLGRKFTLRMIGKGVAHRVIRGLREEVRQWRGGEVGELDDTGNSGEDGNMDIHPEDAVGFQNSVPIRNLEPTSEELVEVVVEVGDLHAGDVSKSALNISQKLDKDDPDAWLHGDMHGTNILGEDKPDAMLIIDNKVTTLSHARDSSSKDKGKKVVGSTSAAKWKKRARHIDMQHPQVQAPGVFSGTRKRGLEYSEGCGAAPPFTMRVLSLNCRGLGNQATVNELHGVVKLEVPKIVFLMETRLPVRKLEFLRVKFGMRGCFGVNRKRFGGGLALFWDDSVTLHIQSYSLFHIDTHVIQGDGATWRFTGFYGHPEAGLRVRSWALLHQLYALADLPWVLIGDFNEISALEEKYGREDRSLRQMANFREALSDCSLMDLGFIGFEFTWSNNREDESLVRVRLDRGVASQNWQTLFPNATVNHITFVNSDHMALLMDMTPCQQQPRRKKHKMFRFDHTWIREEGCEDAIAEAWQLDCVGTSMFRLVHKIKQCRLQLIRWSQSQVRVTPRLIEKKKCHLQALEKQRPEVYNAREVNSVRRELCGLMKQEETFWRQRSRVAWLHGGDNNSKYFHECASQRKRTNTIHGLRDSTQTWQTDPGVMENIAVEYFQSLFVSSNPTHIAPVTQLVDEVVTHDMNMKLLHPFTTEEVKTALFQMHPSKAPGPDGMTALFFQKYWHIVGLHVTDAVLDCLNSVRMLGCLNFTNIVLIPKVKAPQSMAQFRPISLCNVIYKLISKVLVNRMKYLLTNVISACQSAFVPGRMITDNIIVSFEMLHFLKNKRGGKVGQMAAKLDMSKAYDRVEWDYLRAILLKLGFHDQWVAQVMMCVTSVTYSIMLNGEQKGFIRPERGLRQGDPLSPYLFLVCAEGLSALLRKAKEIAFFMAFRFVGEGWKEKLLSQAGREVLIKAVIQAIPTYAMSCFKFPKGLCSEISSMATRFWWGQRGLERKVHWLGKNHLIRRKSEGGMGFHELSLFNMALLARQGWRLVQYPDSLVSRVLKAKYYPNQSFMEASIKGTPSYIFRSICEAREVLSAGMVWRVGTGENIRIWKDRWLQGAPSATILSPPRILDVNATVGTLILQDSMQWDVELIDQIFLPWEAEIVKQIPLTSASAGTIKVFWDGVWSSQVQPKVRNFIWRACRNILPTKTKLFEKKISSSFSSPWSEEEPETCDHVLWQCEFAQKVWSACSVSLPRGVDIRLSFLEVMECCLKGLKSPEVEIIFNTAWMLWRARNELLWEETQSTVDDICCRGVTVAMEFLENRMGDGDKFHQPQVVKQPTSWSPPANGSYKVTIACHVQSGTPRRGVGILIRDHSGFVEVASGFVSQKYSEPLLLYSLAVFHALQLAYETGFRHSLVIEVPCRELVNLLQNGAFCLAQVGVLLDDIGAWLPFFENVSFSFINSVCNKAAQALATEAASSHLDHVWLEECPPCIVSFV
uniref:Reverse transcriptase domain-containing protein n=1 Tax=Fagus sylvatica TaxID=28930 RepID=A0A2N9FK76_FAGSY